jgi:uncharacterized protein (TIGR03435 family)
MRLYALFALCVVTSAQTQPAFEVVSVKPSLHGPARMRSDPGRMIIESQAVDALIRVAYGLREYQYQGPPWLHTARYDIVATTASPQARSAQLVMLRALLADRFRLKLHHESKTMPVYNLVLAKNGPKLTAMEASQPEPFELYSNFSMATVGDRTELRGYGSLGQFADFLTRIAERPVIDRTGIAGAFELRLLCAIDGFPGYDVSPTVFEALPAQMGLKLEAATAAIEITIVDHAEKPAAN